MIGHHMPNRRTARPEGWPKLMRDWIGLRVRSKRDFQNGYGSIPKGTLFTIKGISRGVLIHSEACNHCGQIMFISRISPNDLELVK